MKTIQSEFKRHGITKQKNSSRVVQQPKKKECFSKWDIEELMGIRRDTYKRQNGAIRRR